MLLGHDGLDDQQGSHHQHRSDDEADDHVLDQAGQNEADKGQKKALAAAPGRIGELFPALPAEAGTTLPAGKEFPVFANQT